MFAIMAQFPMAMHYSYMSMIKARVAPLSRTKSKTEQKMAPGCGPFFCQHGTSNRNGNLEAQTRLPQQGIRLNVGVMLQQKASSAGLVTK
jgi:hypothetical protein